MKQVPGHDLNLDDRDSVDSAVLALERGIIAACNAAILKKRYYAKSVPWWEPKLTLLRKGVNKTRKKYQKCRNEAIKIRLWETSKNQECGRLLYSN